MTFDLFVVFHLFVMIDLFVMFDLFVMYVLFVVFDLFMMIDLFVAPDSMLSISFLEPVRHSCSCWQESTIGIGRACEKVLLKGY